MLLKLNSHNCFIIAGVSGELQTADRYSVRQFAEATVRSERQ